MTPTYPARSITRAQVKRLLWRAGFGPLPHDIEALAGRSIQSAVRSLTRAHGAARLVGPEPHDKNGPIAPYDVAGHDHLWWLDRMVRSDQPLVERMTLIWHDWFATSNATVASQRLMLDQNALFRRHALGSFKDLLTGVTQDPAMLVWLNGIENRRDAPNENYARELMELFTLGADRDAYTETDVRQLALALTGWTATFTSGLGWQGFGYDESRRDRTEKTVFGKSGDFDWRDAVTLVLEHPLHASFFVTKLWSYFIPTPPSASTRATLERVYRDSGYSIRPVVETILMQHDLYAGPTMIKPPVVYAAGLLRTAGRGIDRDEWSWLCANAGQRLFYPPDVAGWNDSAWLDTSTWLARFQLPTYALNPAERWAGAVDPWAGYSHTEDAETAVANAIEYFGNPGIRPEPRNVLVAFARECLPATMTNLEQSVFRAMRQNALRQLVASCPDYQTC
jgi:uncharacterized protein (DUF1800 family)